MPSPRLIYPELFKSETVADLSLGAVYTFIGVLTNADDEGFVLNDADADAISDLWAVRSDASDHDVTQYVGELLSGNFIEQVVLEGLPYLHIVNFARYQGGGRGAGRPAGSKITYPARFEKDIWALYPRKTNKSGAAAAYRARLRQGVSHELLVKALNGYLEHIKREGTEAKYIMHGSTFLGPYRWTDFLPIEEPEAVFDLAAAWASYQNKGWWVDEDGKVRQDTPPEASP